MTTTGADFLAQVADEFDLDAADKVLCESIAAMIDDAQRTRSLRDRRACYRLINEQVRTFYARQAASDSGSQQQHAPLTRSEAARKMALSRWHPAA